MGRDRDIVGHADHLRSDLLRSVPQDLLPCARHAGLLETHALLVHHSLRAVWAVLWLVARPVLCRVAPLLLALERGDLLVDDLSGGRSRYVACHHALRQVDGEVLVLAEPDKLAQVLPCDLAGAGLLQDRADAVRELRRADRYGDVHRIFAQQRCNLPRLEAADLGVAVDRQRLVERREVLALQVLCDLLEQDIASRCGYLVGYGPVDLSPQAWDLRV